ncbi:STAS domain-containing protein [Blastococcus goldschmidtiae]|uniref:STAS domain-containing protein n=1 Tax=Blastococcus goldschmidtiae TaxID=3075546 RepID=A0ABU2K4U1_9ACTN|nr:STAS domain-containing protein [Blastococcus sp. DSM 46792]MDT0275226.1 STAS domain-containing protein [Blastococcus sp. DSM 46792]
MELTDEVRARMDVSDDPDGGLVVTLAGELDLASLPAVASPLDELLSRRQQPVVLDLAELSFLDSSGVAVLVRIANHFDRVRTRSATQPVRRVIEVLGLAARFGLEEH